MRRVPYGRDVVDRVMELCARRVVRAEIARLTGLTFGQVAGLIYRERGGAPPPAPPKGHEGYELRLAGARYEDVSTELLARELARAPRPRRVVSLTRQLMGDP